MPPRIRATKSLKENIGVATKTKLKVVDRITKPSRKVFGDKTNSASDENASFEDPVKAAKKACADTKLTRKKFINDDVARPRRNRRVPSRFEENVLLKSLSNSSENAPVSINNKEKKKEAKLDCKKEDIVKEPLVVPNAKEDNLLSVKSGSTTALPFKTPEKIAEISLVASRPRRISRLPSRFEDHSISPSKFIPVQPCHASTPLAQKNVKTSNAVKNTNEKVNKNSTNDKSNPNVEQPKQSNKNKAVQKKTNKQLFESSDTNNNAKTRTLRTRNIVNSDDKKNGKSKERTIKSPVKKIVPSKAKKSPVKLNTPVKQTSAIKHSYLNEINENSSIKVINTKSLAKQTNIAKKPTQRALKSDLSFKVLENNKKNGSNQDVYEFTFDPAEEPVPQKKKRKPVKRKPAKPKPKTYYMTNNYDRNVSKALAALKMAVNKTPNNPNTKSTEIDNTSEQPKVFETSKNKESCQPTHTVAKTTETEAKTRPQVQRDVASKIIISNPQPKQAQTNNDRSVPQIQQNILMNVKNVQPNAPYKDVPVQVSHNTSKVPMPHQSIRVEDIAADFETSPLHDIDYSPVNSPRPITPVAQTSIISNIHHSDDPLNLRENISFNPNPIASSSMNISERHASPWRVEFGSLPIRWHVNSYVKPNMTPAVECSFVDFDDNKKKKHVYTNLVPEHNEKLPEIVEKAQPNLIQSSLFSFIKEVVEKSSNKKKNRGRSTTPVTASLFNDGTNKTPNKNDDNVQKTTRQLFTPQKSSAKNNTKDDSNEKENSKDSSQGHKRKNIDEPNVAPAKTPRKDKDDRYFGFDDSENLDQENISPQKDVGRKKSLRQRARAVLKDINYKQSGPTRAVIPVAAKTARQAEVERLYDEMKSASNAPEFPVKDPIVIGTKNVIDPVEELTEDSQTSVHLFEDIDFCHHLKHQRKSYGKAKKVTFVTQASTDSDTQDSDMRPETNVSEEEEDLNDLTFDPGLPFIDEERKKTKKKQTKRQKMAKKEEEEAEAWAASFNSMCEDVEEFSLVVE